MVVENSTHAIFLQTTLDMEAIETRILNYYGYIQDTDYLAATLNSTSLEGFCNIINQLLRSEDEETVGTACLFVNDLALFGSSHPDCENFLQSYPESSIVTTLEQLLFSENYITRKRVVYTLGKTCSYSSLAALNRAFTEFRDTDPILLPRLIGEMGWLGADNFWVLLDLMMSSPVYATRWAVIAVLSEFIGDPRVNEELFQGKLSCLYRLRQDTNSSIRAEAEYEYQLLKLRGEIYNLPRADRKRQWKAVEREYRPAFYVDRVLQAFDCHLHKQGFKQYSVNELETFIANMIQSHSIHQSG